MRSRKNTFASRDLEREETSPMTQGQPKLSKDVELLEKAGRWIAERFEQWGEAMGRLIRRLLPSRNLRVLASLHQVVLRINALEPRIEAMSREDLCATTLQFKERLKDLPIEEQEKALDEILPECFAMVREASKRTIGLRHFDVQLIGGIVLHQGKIAEMSTGEGKTLVATCSVYLNALAGKGVYVVTVNDYLARRDREWMGPIYEYLGLTVGAIQSSMDPRDRQPHYACDITYGTNNEFGFDYLRDNMKTRREDQVQKHLHFAVIDEVDSILIDEARTPLIISGMPEASTRKYYIADGVARRLHVDAHFEVKEKENTVVLSEEGIEEAQRLVGVDSFYEGPNMDWPHHLEQALRAHHLYKIDKHYVKRLDENQVPEIVIVDEFTGRMMPGRRWSDGLHQAIEAKEGIRIREESQTLATITFQNYFRLYHKIAGMTGTAITEAAEFSKIYSLDVLQIPTNRPNQRIDHEDVIYGTEGEKFPVIVEEIVELHRLGRPALVGTASIEKSETLSRFLGDPAAMTEVLARRAGFAVQWIQKDKKLDAAFKQEATELLKRPARLDLEAARRLEGVIEQQSPKDEALFWIAAVVCAAEALDQIKKGVPHNVLNAKYHEREAEIIAQAGRKGAVTIATNMAGRGTDIVLGGHPEFLAKEEVRKCGDPARYPGFLEQFKEQCAKEKTEVITLGGLHVLGTERHEARRIDNQLRGRTARQGDPGSSRFYLSLQDDLMRIFASERVQRILEFVGMTEGVDIQSPMVSRSVQRAQKKVENRNFDIRKNLLEYDEVMDKQRRTIYGLRQEVLEGVDVSDRIRDMIKDVVERLADVYLLGDRKEFDLAGFAEALGKKIGHDVKQGRVDASSRDEVLGRALQQCDEQYQEREKELTIDEMRRIERYLLLHVIDQKWKDHLLNLDALRSGIGLRQMGQIDPKNEFKREGWEYFEQMLVSIAEEVTNIVYRLKLPPPGQLPPPQASPVPRLPPMSPTSSTLAPRSRSASPLSGLTPDARKMQQQRVGFDRAALGSGKGPTGSIRRKTEKVGRNDPCPCGSGQKYKKCCGQGEA